MVRVTASGWHRSLVVALLAVVGAVAPASVDAGPTDVLREAFADASRVLAHHASSHDRMASVPPMLAIVERVVDFRHATELALGREWARRTPQEQTEFTQLFTALLERSLVLAVATRVDLDRGLDIRYHGERIHGELATVRTTLAVRDGSEVSVDYRMAARDGRWMIRDVVFDGVSTIGNYQAQFSRVLMTASYEDLLARVRLRAEAVTALTAYGDGRATGGTNRVTDHDDRSVADDHRVPGKNAQPPVLITAPLASDTTKAAGSDDTRDGRVAMGEPVRRVDSDRADKARPAATHGRQEAKTAASERRAAGFEAQPSPGRAGPSRYWVQVGAFRSTDTATRLASRLRAQRFETRVVPTRGTSDRTQARSPVQVGPFTDRARAVSTIRALEGRGFRPFVAVEPD